MNRLRFTAIRTQNVAGETIADNEPSEEEVRDCVYRILEGTMLCSIATVTPAGDPHINTAYFSYSDSLDVYFLSHPGSLHCRNLASHPTMAMTVFSSAQDWAEASRGIQLFGTGEETSGSRMEQAERSYAARFQAYGTWKAALDHEDPARLYRFYRFAVTEVKVLDEQNLGDAVWVIGSVASQ